MTPREIEGLQSILHYLEFLNDLKHGDSMDLLTPTSVHPIQEERVIGKVVKEPKRATLTTKISKQGHHNRAMVRNPWLEKKGLAIRVAS